MKGRHVFGEHGKPDQYFLDGKEVTRAEYDAAFPDKPIGGSAPCFFKPIVSDALAVHPRQVKEATEDARRKGVPTDFQPDGRPIFRTRQHRSEYLRRYGFYDRQAGYGDPAPGSFKGDLPDRPDPAKEY